MEKQGTILGIPYDFRKPTFKRMKARMWNPADERIITPRTTGIGWTINLYQLKQRSPLAFYALMTVVVVGIARSLYKFFTADGE
ncbi:MAG: DUF5808 domain-containing protein [Candidatus Geothermincolia bacterium]